MATKIPVPLIDGLRVGDDIMRDAEVREITGSDLIDAQFEAERLVETAAGPMLVASPAAMGLALLRRQVVRIGNFQGPLELKDLRRLSAADLAALQAAAERLDIAAGKDLSASVAGRGRDEGVGATG